MIINFFVRRAAVAEHGRLGLALLMLGLWGCGGSSSREGTTTPATPSAEARIITVGPTVTAAAVALGLGDRIIAVDLSSKDLTGLRDSLPIIGYHRQLAAEGLLGLKPTVVLASDKAGPPSTLEALRKAGVRVEILPGGDSVSHIARAVSQLGEQFDRKTGSQQLITSLDSAWAAIDARARALNRKPRFAVCYSRGSADKLFFMGTDQPFSQLAERAGGVPAVAFTGSKPLNPEAVLAANPEVLILPQETAGLLGGLDALKTNPVLRATTAVQKGQVVAVSGPHVYGYSVQSPAVGLQLVKAYENYSH
jgi:iron complex transport system substrate-binding protein